MNVFGPSGRAGARLTDVEAEVGPVEHRLSDEEKASALEILHRRVRDRKDARAFVGGLSFHQAWGEAKDRPDYNKEDWKGAQTRVEACEFTLAEWLTLVRGMRVLAPGWRRL